MNTSPSPGFRRGGPARWLGILLLAVCCRCLQAAEGDELFSGGVVPRLQIEIPPAGMRVLRNYHQERGGPRPERVDVRATVREGTQVYTNVAVHLKGSWSFQGVDGKPSLTLNFDKFAPGQRFHGLDKLHLNNSVQDETYLHEALAREVFNEAGVPTPRAGHASVALNGRDLGFYVLLEGANRRFLKRHYESVEGNLYDGGSGGDLTSGKIDVDSGRHRDDRSDLKALAAAAGERDPAARFARLEQLLDVDRFLTFTALEVLFVHWDGYGLSANNYHVFQDAARGRLIFMPRGMDQILGQRGSLSASIVPRGKGMVTRALLSTPEGRRRYLARLEEVFREHFQAESLNAKVDRLADRARPVAAPGMLAGLAFQWQVRSLKSRIARRVEAVAAQLAAAGTSTDLPADGELDLTGWRFRAGPMGTAAGGAVTHQGRELLEVRTGGPGDSGSWRMSVTVPEGRYALTATGRTMDLPAGTEGAGILLRVSGERSAAGLVVGTNWSRLRYEFLMESPGRVELIGEFRGSRGTGQFDRSSFRLRRL